MIVLCVGTGGLRATNEVIYDVEIIVYHVATRHYVLIVEKESRAAR